MRPERQFDRALEPGWKPARIVVLRALPGLGDMLCSVPALRVLRKAFPESRIAVAGLGATRALLLRFGDYVDDFLELPGFPGLTGRTDIGRLTGFLLDIQRRRYDLAIQLHGSGVISNVLLSLFNAGRTAGFYLPGQWRPDPNLFLPYPEDQHEILRNLALVEHLGLEPQGTDLEFPIEPPDWQELRAAVGPTPLRRGQYVCVHPGASSVARRWPTDRFAAVADWLSERGFEVVLTGGSGEWELNRRVAGAMNRGCRNLAGPVSVGALAALLSDARLLVSNDTGVSHLVAALRVPSVVVFTAGDPRRWAPLDSQLHRVAAVPVDCRPCSHSVCPIGHPCATGVTLEAVLREVGALLGEEYRNAA